HGTALAQAVHRGSTSCVKTLLLRGADIHKIGQHSRSTRAAGLHSDIVELLLEHGLDVNEHGGHALQLALFEGVTQAVDVLLKSGAEINIRGGPYGCPINAA
ncbi:hypothetical protein BCR34DRAFT_456836, partial [Clohesyomyces aquaticus]